MLLMDDIVDVLLIYSWLKFSFRKSNETIFSIFRYNRLLLSLFIFSMLFELFCSKMMIFRCSQCLLSSKWIIKKNGDNDDDDKWFSVRKRFCETITIMNLLKVDNHMNNKKKFQQNFSTKSSFISSFLSSFLLLFMDHPTCRYVRKKQRGKRIFLREKTITSN